MIESNETFADQTHRIYISSPKSTTDRTGLYIFSLLLSLLLILIVYLVYNFISYRRYSNSRKKQDLFEKQFNDRLRTILNQSLEQQPIQRASSYEELILPIPQSPTSLPDERKDKSISNQYHITNQLVSDL